MFGHVQFIRHVVNNKMMGQRQVDQATLSCESSLERNVPSPN